MSAQGLATPAHRAITAFKRCPCPHPARCGIAAILGAVIRFATRGDAALGDCLAPLFTVRLSGADGGQLCPVLWSQGQYAQSRGPLLTALRVTPLVAFQEAAAGCLPVAAECAGCHPAWYR